jgi:hypothetical protein
MQTREEAAQRAGQWQQDLAQRPAAPVAWGQARGKVFIDVTIEGQRFQGLRDGNTLHLLGPRCSGVLGATSINHVARWSTGGDGTPAWRLCKYRDQGEAVPLALSPAGLNALALTFGLAIVPELQDKRINQLFERELFYLSPAFASLQAWAVGAPRRIAGSLGDDHLGLWPISALDGVYVPTTPENVARARARIAPPVAAHG